MIRAFIKIIIAGLQKLITFLDKKFQVEMQEQDTLLCSLAPKIISGEQDLGKVKPYLDSLRQAINAKGINNIAVAGSYGSGKSMTLLNGNAHEAQDAILNILNNPDVSLRLKEKVLSSQETLIQSILDVDGAEVMQLVLSSNRIFPSWQNVFDYFDEIGNDHFDEVLIAFLNDPHNYQTLSETELSPILGRDEDYIKDICNEILHCSKFSLESFTMLIESVPYVFDIIRYDEFDADRIGTLLDKRKLALTSENFSGLKEKSGNLSLRLVEIHQISFVNDFAELPLEPNDWLLIFRSSAIAAQLKLSLIQQTDESIIVDNSDVAGAVCALLPSDRRIPLSYEALRAIFKSATSVEKRVELLNLNFSELDDEQIQTLTDCLGGDYPKIFKKQHKPIFPNSEYNTSFFNRLMERNLIIRHELKENENTIKVFAKY